MPSLVSDSQKAILGDALNDVFLSFVRPVTIWKTANTVIISSDPNTYNFIYAENQPANVIEYQPVSGVFDASISWGTPGNFNENEIRANIYGGLCQVDLTDEGYNFISGYQSIVVDGVPCSIDFQNPAARPHGLFDVRYKCLYLRRNN